VLDATTVGLSPSLRHTQHPAQSNERNPAERHLSFAGNCSDNRSQRYVHIIMDNYATHIAVALMVDGAGKARAGRDGSLRESKSWRVIVISSGEIPLENKLTEGRGNARAG
jgi:hypothetical protein